ncbi:SDR family oxidoreductase [Microbacterium sp. CFH 90308]|uniref:SDR family oxidoreductase n=1 Tax=Microbacterium salsuginis TaxID=2722803 RepID=A0ABX1KEP3_9MICO|nr:SDR family oxidoreductase [Microbacterium sp. CFH 90308]NLP85040.1 SDR family oxidoreductase [Microbacterium sp. CFH 90308]
MFPSTSLPLRGKTALVTGVSRRRGIGFAVATQFARLGADVFIHHYRPHDTDLPWGGDDLDAVRGGLRDELTPSASLGDIGADLRDAASVPLVIEAARALTGRLDILVCNHAKSGDDGSILDMTADRLDAFWQANARSTLLLTREFAALHGGDRSDSRPGERIGRSEPFAEPTGRVFWMTSGQIHGPMRGEVAYAASKSVLAGLTKTVAAELLDLGIILNTIDPGPVNTGYLDPGTTDRPLDEIEAWMRATPFGRYGQPDDPARLIAWLATPAGAWVVGQVLSTDGGLGLG